MQTLLVSNGVNAQSSALYHTYLIIRNHDAAPELLCQYHVMCCVPGW